ncbi:hypothetical protein CVT91_02680 [Candidatus Atribacteria bacterium HGW-Atribacteria-1]|nr:MAG: hypothetical protein CVT91_02680 [Candidatus Atribacteria bacterium HGW-Atribacteria-1]
MSFSDFNQFVKELGNGEVIRTATGKKIFKMSPFEGNPVVKPQDVGLSWYKDGKLQTGAVFNGGAEIFEGKVILLPRCQKNYQRKKFFDEKSKTERYWLDNYISEIWPLISEDGVNFKRYNNIVIRGDSTDHQDFIYGIEDIRIVRHHQKYILIGTGKIKPPFKGKNADRVAIYSTEDFINITYHGIIDSFDNRNAIPFFDNDNDKVYMLLRFHPNINLAVLEGRIDQLLNPSRYRKNWEKIYQQKDENILIEVGMYPHEKEKVGAGIPLIKTERGWLFIYHAVGEINKDICKEYGVEGKTKRAYSVCAAILDLDNPKKVMCRTKNPIYIPSKPYELEGNKQYPVDVPNVVFPTGAIVSDNKLLLYCGAGDKYTILLSCDINKLIDYMFKNCKVE